MSSEWPERPTAASSVSSLDSLGNFIDNTISKFNTAMGRNAESTANTEPSPKPLPRPPSVSQLGVILKPRSSIGDRTPEFKPSPRSSSPLANTSEMPKPIDVEADNYPVRRMTVDDHKKKISQLKEYLKDSSPAASPALSRSSTVSNLERHIQKKLVKEKSSQQMELEAQAKDVLYNTNPAYSFNAALNLMKKENSKDSTNSSSISSLSYKYPIDNSQGNSTSSIHLAGTTDDAEKKLSDSTSTINFAGLANDFENNVARMMSQPKVSNEVRADSPKPMDQNDESPSLGQPISTESLSNLNREAKRNSTEEQVARVPSWLHESKAKGNHSEREQEQQPHDSINSEHVENESVIQTGNHLLQKTSQTADEVQSSQSKVTGLLEEYGVPSNHADHSTAAENNSGGDEELKAMCKLKDMRIRELQLDVAELKNEADRYKLEMEVATAANLDKDDTIEKLMKKIDEMENAPSDLEMNSRLSEFLANKKGSGEEEEGRGGKGPHAQNVELLEDLLSLRKDLMGIEEKHAIELKKEKLKAMKFEEERDECRKELQSLQETLMSSSDATGEVSKKLARCKEQLQIAKQRIKESEKAQEYTELAMTSLLLEARVSRKSIMHGKCPEKQKGSSFPSSTPKTNAKTDSSSAILSSEGETACQGFLYTLVANQIGSTNRQTKGPGTRPKSASAARGVYKAPSPPKHGQAPGGKAGPRARPKSAAPSRPTAQRSRPSTAKKRMPFSANPAELARRPGPTSACMCAVCKRIDNAYVGTR
eukprot:Nk52_evm103s485 gene=Nk52_evmTU103s485